MKLSFRNRIALLTASAAAVTIGLVFILVYAVVVKTAYRHLDDDIRHEKGQVLNSLRWAGDTIVIGTMSEWHEREHQEVEVNPIFLQVVDTSGGLLFRSANLKNDLLLFDPGILWDAYFNSRIGERRIRQGQFPILNENDTIIGHLTIGISQEESAIVLQNLKKILLITFPLLLGVLYLATSLAAAKGIAPVQKLIQAASGIHEVNIDARLPLPANKDELYQLANTINELLARVESGVMREKQFTADASHELRTPLTAIRGTLEVLIRRQREPFQYEEKINRVIEEVDRLHGMLDQLLQLSRLEGGYLKINKNPIPLRALFLELAEKWEPELKKKNMKLKLDVSPIASPSTDAGLLKIIMDNLINNAVKYGHEGGRIDLTWRQADQAIILQDDGIGILPEQLSHIFERFYRADGSLSSIIHGVGLGLSISKKLADAMGIKISASSCEGEGTTFVLRF